MAIFISIIVLVVLLCINGFLANKMSDAAENKGYDKRTYFHICFWLGVIGYLIVIALPDLTIRKQNEKIIKLLETISAVSSVPAPASVSSNTVAKNASIQLPSL